VTTKLALLHRASDSLSAEEIQATFHTNVFAHIAVTKAVLPIMRDQKSGTIAFMGSIAGWEGGVACSLYCGVKFAMAGIAESLREEVASFGIQVTVIEPGYFRTNFLAGGNKVVAKTPIAAYEPVLAPLKGAFAAFDGNQPGDPTKGATLIVEALTGTGRAQGRELPRRLLIGPDAVGFVTGVMEKETKSVEAWKDLSVTTNL
jgi:NAD(P)-dependent dehydrogenase (short-subunit alcohol dehydrogenase family)